MAIEYRYKRKGIGFIVLIVLGFVFIGGWFYLLHWGQEITGVKSDREDFYLTLQMIFTALGLSYIGYIGWRFFQKAADDVIMLDEQGITHRKSKTEKIYIAWDQVEIVSYGPKMPPDFEPNMAFIEKYPTTCIVILSEDKEIIIGKGIEKLPEIIRFIKSKVGERFNTFDIPAEWKYKQIGFKKTEG